MFTKPKNLESTFQAIRLLCVLTILSSFAFSGFVAWQSSRKLAAAQNKIYVLSEGRALEAVTAERSDNLSVEARDHIGNFHLLFFTLDPDEKAIVSNISHALYLADRSVKQLYDNLKETGYLAGIIAGNISQRITVDSIKINMDVYPYPFICHATQKIIRPTSIVTRDLLTQGWLRTVARTDNNPHGFLIERFTIIQNKDRRVESRQIY